MSPRAKRQMKQVLGMRPNAKMVKGGAGYVVVSGEQCLDYGGSGYVGTADQAWGIAFRHLMHDFRNQDPRP